MFSEMMPPISAIMETTTEKRNKRTRQGLSEAPPTQPMRPEKKRVKPRPMTTYVNICKKKKKNDNYDNKKKKEILRLPHTKHCGKPYLKAFK